MHSSAARAIDLTEHGLVPDSVIRHGIRHMLKAWLDEFELTDIEQASNRKADFIALMNQAPLAATGAACSEYPEMPATFFLPVLGAANKYSCGYWHRGVDSLDMAEALALTLTCEHAAIEDGMDILELGCGWGSLTLWMAMQYPASHITALTGSQAQRTYLLNSLEALKQVREQDIARVEVVVSELGRFDRNDAFDRVVTVEMVERVRNYRALFENVSRWLKADGSFLMHTFCQRGVPYVPGDNEVPDWLSRHFFCGGMMPSDDLPLYFQDHLRLLRQWRWNGTHYEKTANAWLHNMDSNKSAIWPVLEQVYGKQAAQQWWNRWRMYFMACAELFGYDGGRRWWVSHYLFANRGGK